MTSRPLRRRKRTIGPAKCISTILSKRCDGVGTEAQIRRYLRRNLPEENPPDGAILDYELPPGVNNVTLEIFDSNDKSIRKYDSHDKAPVTEAELKPGTERSNLLGSSIF